MDYRSAKKIHINDKLINKKTGEIVTVIAKDKFKHHGKKYIIIDCIAKDNNFKRFTHLDLLEKKMMKKGDKYEK